MLTDARGLADGTTLRTQVCVIGGGAAGITIARHLAGGPIDVVLVESGGLEPHEATQDLYRGDLVGAPFYGAGNEIQLDECRLRYLGGTTNHWTGFCRPLDPVDFAVRPYLHLSGWPISRADLDPWYERAVEVIRLADPRFDLDWWREQHDLGEPILDTDLVSTSMFQVHVPYPFAVVHRDALEAAANVDVLLWANATRLDVEDNSDRVTSVEVRTLGGVGLTVEADVFVVALGGIETPRLLLASNDVRSAGLGNVHDLVGRHFAEHLRAQVGHVVLRRTPADLSLYEPTTVAAPHPDDPANAIAVQGALTLTQQAVLDNQLLGLEFQFTYVRAPEPSGRIHADGLRMDDVAPLRAAVDGGAGALAYVQVLGEQELNPDSRVRLGSGTDALGMPTIELDWRHTALDRVSIVAGLAVLGRELGRTGEGRLLSLPGGIGFMDEPLAEEDFPFLEASATSVDPDGFQLGVGFHHMSTTRMSDDPTTGVVDADCRVHDLANLYVAGSSVFATACTATPTFTITALALRLADHLRGTLT
jgi:choline dehydrogenase-like flavoprotein